MSEDREKPTSLDLTAIELNDLLGFFIGILSEKAWQHMGFRLIPGKSELEKDMVKAKVAIDCTAFLTEKMIPSLSADEARMIRAMLADIQLNYVKQV